MAGKLIIIAGFPCSGKTTYIDAIQEFFGVFISRRDFFTNRPPRSEEERNNSKDYTFVSDAEYEKLSKQTDWHWTKWYGFYYGFCIPLEITRLEKGEKIAMGPAPKASYLHEMQKIHGKNKILSIFLDVDREIIASRLKKRPQNEHKRILAFNQSEIDECAKAADIIFVPKNNLIDDCKRFIEMAEPYIS